MKSETWLLVPNMISCVCFWTLNACVSFWKLVLVTNRKKGVWVRSVPEWSEGRADWTQAYLLSATINSCWLSHSQESYLPFSPKSLTPRSPEWKNKENVWNNVGLLAFSSGRHSCLGIYFLMPSEVWIRWYMPSIIFHFLGVWRFFSICGPYLSCYIKHRAVAGDINELAGL